MISDQKVPVPLESLMQRYWDWNMRTSPERATWQGYLGHNDKWTDLSRDAIETRKANIRGFLAEADAIDISSLNPTDLLNHALLQRELAQLVEGQRFPSELMVLTPLRGPHTNGPQWFRMMPRAKPEHFADFISRLEELPAFIGQSIDLMKEGIARGVTQARVVLRDADEMISAQIFEDPFASSLLEPFREMPRTISKPEATKLRDAAAKLYSQGVAPRLKKLVDFVKDEYLPACTESIGLGDLPDGEEWYAYLVRVFTTLDTSPKEVHEVGLSEVERIRAKMDEVITESGFKGDFEQFFEFLRTDPQFFFSSANELLAAYRDICKRADPELARLFGTLPRLPYGVIPVPDDIAKTQTTAYYSRGSLEMARPGYFYANTYDLASRPKWEMEALSLHEAVPGHHLQISLAAELEGVPDFRKHSLLTAFTEGWGLYAESLGEEMGFYQDSYSRFGQLTYEMWRAIRLVVDTGMHALGWDRDKAIDFFRANAGKADHDIIVEVDRYISWPGQAISYKTGELKMKGLRRFAEERLGNAFDIRSFHDRLIGDGPLPLDVLDQRIRAWVEGS